MSVKWLKKIKETTNDLLVYGNFAEEWSWWLESLDFENTLWVSENGDDSTGLRNDMSKPYLTIGAAIDDAQDWDTIYLMPWSYSWNDNSVFTTKVLNFVWENVTIDTNFFVLQNWWNTLFTNCSVTVAFLWCYWDSWWPCNFIFNNSFLICSNRLQFETDEYVYLWWEWFNLISTRAGSATSEWFIRYLAAANFCLQFWNSWWFYKTAAAWSGHSVFFASGFGNSNVSIEWWTIDLNKWPDTALWLLLCIWAPNDKIRIKRSYIRWGKFLSATSIFAWNGTNVEILFIDCFIQLEWTGTIANNDFLIHKIFLDSCTIINRGNSTTEWFVVLKDDNNATPINSTWIIKDCYFSSENSTYPVFKALWTNNEIYLIGSNTSNSALLDGSSTLSYVWWTFIQNNNIPSIDIEPFRIINSI